MRAPRSLVTFTLCIGTVSMLLTTASSAVAQQIPTPGETPEEIKEWTYYLSFPVLLGAIGLILLLAVSYLVLARRFFGKEELPAAPQRRRSPQFAGGGTASVMAPPAPSAAGPAAPARSTAVQAGRAPATAAPPRPAAAPARPPVEEKPSPEPAAARAAATPEATAQAEARPAPAAAPEHVEPDQETLDRILKEQLDKGIDRRVAEGRAKAAAIRAAKAGAAAAPAAQAPQAEAGATDAPAEAPPTEEGTGPAAEKPAAEGKAEAEASVDAQAATMEPEVVEPAAPAAEQEADEPAKVHAPAPKTAAEPAEPADQPKPTAPAGADQETFDQVLEEQLGKGLPRPIAEGRARAAAIKAAREKAGA
jgi:hypothetical protein